jgi:hypothetical protein
MQRAVNVMALLLAIENSVLSVSLRHNQLRPATDVTGMKNTLF